MTFELLHRFRSFGFRSVLTHAIMAVTFVAAIGSGLFIEGDLGFVSFVALLNFTAGMWVCQTIHSIGNSASDDEYEGILRYVTKNVG